MLAEFRDYLKSHFNADYYFIGKVEQWRDKSIGIYGGTAGARVEAVGRESSYDIATIRILLHWNKNAKETEAAARTLYETIRYITRAEMGAYIVQYVDLTDGEPNFLGTDDVGVYEYAISVRIYYRRNINVS